MRAHQFYRKVWRLNALVILLVGILGVGVLMITAFSALIMIVAGALTCTMAYAMIAPQAALLSAFGESLQGPVADIVVRNWGAQVLPWWSTR